MTRTSAPDLRRFGALCLAAAAVLLSGCGPGAAARRTAPSASRAASAAEDKAGQAEAEGRKQEALELTCAALRAAPPPEQEYRLRKAAIRLAQSLEPAPATPEDAETYTKRGGLALSAAKDRADFLAAAAELETAALSAPWLGPAYFNLGVAYRSAGEGRKAARNFRLYALASPGADDAAQAKDWAVELEFQADKAERERRAAAEFLARLEGATYDRDETDESSQRTWIIKIKRGQAIWGQHMHRSDFNDKLGYSENCRAPIRDGSFTCRQFRKNWTGKLSPSGDSIFMSNDQDSCPYPQCGEYRRLGGR